MKPNKLFGHNQKPSQPFVTKDNLDEWFSNPSNIDTLKENDWRIQYQSPDGTSFNIVPIVPDGTLVNIGMGFADLTKLLEKHQDFIRQMSQQDVQNRFGHRPNQRTIDYLTAGSFKRGSLLLYAFDGEPIDGALAGIARVEPVKNPSAFDGIQINEDEKVGEISIAVDGNHQRMGLGYALALMRFAIAKENGYETLVAEIFAGNVASRGLAAKIPYSKKVVGNTRIYSLNQD